MNEARAKRLSEVKAKQEEAAESKKDAESAFKAGNTFFVAQMLFFEISFFILFEIYRKISFPRLKICHYSQGMEKQEGRK